MLFRTLNGSNTLHYLLRAEPVVWVYRFLRREILLMLARAAGLRRRSPEISVFLCRMFLLPAFTYAHVKNRNASWQILFDRGR